MRELFENVPPDDPLEATRRSMRMVLPRRFYETAATAAVADGYAVRLDDKPVRTPARRVLAAPTLALAEAIAAGDVTAITPYLKVLDRLDRYQSVAVANQAYDDEARKKLMDKINRMAANFGVDEVMAAAAHAHLIKIGAIPPHEPGEADAAEDPRPAEEQQEGQNEAVNWTSV